MAVLLAVLGLAAPAYILGQLWLTGSTWIVVAVPLIFAPLVVVPLTASGRPGCVASVVALAASAATAALGVAMQRLLAWVVTVDGSWYQGPGGYGESDYPWHAYGTAALVYAAGGALLLVLLVAALIRTHHSSQVPAPRLGQGVGREDAGSA